MTDAENRGVFRKSRQVGTREIPTLSASWEMKHTTFTKIEGDFVKKPGVQMMDKIAKALNVSIEDLL